MAQAGQELENALRERYTQEACGEDSLSCGGALSLAAPKPGERLLDLGCGRGTEVLQAAGLIGSSGEAVGVDITREMLAEAEKRRKAAGIDNALFKLAAMEALPFADGSFTIVISNCAINHAKVKERVYREIYRVLALNGRMVVSDVVSRGMLPDSVTSDPQAWADCFGGAIPEDDYLRTVAAAGFKGVKVLERREYFKNGYPMASITIKGIRKDDGHE